MRDTIISFKIGITGIGGFLGRHAAIDLRRRGHKVIGINSRVDSKSPTNDRHNLRRKLSGLDVVIHAAWAGTRRPERDVMLTQERNIAFARELALGMRLEGVSWVVGLGSQAEYEPAGEPWLDTSKTAPSDAYSSAKIKVHQVFNETDLDVSWLRIGSVYGGTDSANWIVPNLVRACLKKEKITFGPCNNLWSLLHVHDFLEALNSVFLRRMTGPLLVTNPERQMLRRYVSEISELLDATSFVSFDVNGESGRNLNGIPLRLLGVGWSPQVPLSRGISEYARWMKENEIPI